FADQQEGKVKKAALEALSYGAKLAGQFDTTVTALILGPSDTDLASLGQYGADKVLHADDQKLKDFDASLYVTALKEAIDAESAEIIVLAHNFNGKAVAPMLSVKLKAGLAAGAINLPHTSDGFVLKKGAFSGKAFAYVNIKTDKKIISVNPNSFPIEKSDKQAEVSSFSPALPD